MPKHVRIICLLCLVCCLVEVSLCGNSTTLMVCFTGGSFQKYQALVAGVLGTPIDFVPNPPSASLAQIIKPSYSTIFFLITDTSYSFGDSDVTALSNAVNNGARLILMGGMASSFYLSVPSQFFSNVSSSSSWIKGTFVCNDKYPLGVGLPTSIQFSNSAANSYITFIRDSTADNACYGPNGVAMLAGKSYGAGSVVFSSVNFDDTSFSDADVPLIKAITSNALGASVGKCSRDRDCNRCLADSDCQFCRDSQVCQFKGQQCSNIWIKAASCPTICNSTLSCSSCTGGALHGKCFFCLSEDGGPSGSCMSLSSPCNNGKVADPDFC